MKAIMTRLGMPLALALLTAPVANAALVVVRDWDAINLEIPDASGPGGAVTVSDSRTLSSPLEGLSDLVVWVRLAGSDGIGGAGTMWNGDLHVTLTHESGASFVLLNRIGRDVGSPFGASGNGISVTFDASALQDVHGVGGGSILGTYQADGRSTDPFSVTSASPRDAGLDALLSTLGTGSPNGVWTLALTDLESGGLARLEGWGMTLTGVPEPAAYGWLAGGALLALGLWRRAR